MLTKLKVLFKFPHFFHQYPFSVPISIQGSHILFISHVSLAFSNLKSKPLKKEEIFTFHQNNMLKVKFSTSSIGVSQVLPHFQSTAKKRK